MFDFFWEFVGWDLSVFQRYFPTQYWTIQLCCRSIVHHVFDYWHLLDSNCSIAKRLWWNKLWGNTTSARPLVLCSVCSNFEFPRFSTVWMGHIFFSCLESDTKILPPRFLPTKSFFLLKDRPNRYMCIPLPTSTLRFLVSDRLYRSILPTTHFTSLLPTLFFRRVESSQQTLSALSEWAKRSLWQVRAFLWPGLHVEHQKGFLRVSFFLMNSLNTFVL